MKTYPNPTAASLTKDCRCGCGEETSSYRSAYKPGHDSKHITNLLVKIIGETQAYGDGETTQTQLQDHIWECFRELPSAALQDRLYSAVMNYGRGNLATQLHDAEVGPFI